MQYATFVCVPPRPRRPHLISDVGLQLHSWKISPFSPCWLMLKIWNDRLSACLLACRVWIQRWPRRSHSSVAAAGQTGRNSRLWHWPGRCLRRRVQSHFISTFQLATRHWWRRSVETEHSHRLYRHHSSDLSAITACQPRPVQSLCRHWLWKNKFFRLVALWRFVTQCFCDSLLISSEYMAQNIT